MHDLDLTKREQEILEYIAQGYQNPDMAKRLHIAPRTITTHVGRILKKLDARTRAHAVAKAFACGVLTAEQLDLCQNA